MLLAWPVFAYSENCSWCTVVSKLPSPESCIKCTHKKKLDLKLCGFFLYTGWIVALLLVVTAIVLWPSLCDVANNCYYIFEDYYCFQWKCCVFATIIFHFLSLNEKNKEYIFISWIFNTDYGKLSKQSQGFGLHCDILIFLILFMQHLQLQLFAYYFTRF